MAIEIVDLSNYKMVIFHSYVNVYQRVWWPFYCSISIPELDGRECLPETPVFGANISHKQIHW